MENGDKDTSNMITVIKDEKMNEPLATTRHQKSIHWHMLSSGARQGNRLLIM